MIKTAANTQFSDDFELELTPREDEDCDRQKQHCVEQTIHAMTQKRQWRRQNPVHYIIL